MFKSAAFGCALWLACVACLSAKPLSPDIRQVFIKGTTDACFANQVKSPANRDFTLGQIQTYCDCYANGFADGLQEEDLDRNQNVMSAEATKSAAGISQTCAAALKK